MRSLLSSHIPFRSLILLYFIFFTLFHSPLLDRFDASISTSICDLYVEHISPFLSCCLWLLNIVLDEMCVPLPWNHLFLPFQRLPNTRCLLELSAHSASLSAPLREQSLSEVPLAGILDVASASEQVGETEPCRLPKGPRD